MGRRARVEGGEFREALAGAAAGTGADAAEFGSGRTTRRTTRTRTRAGRRGSGRRREEGRGEGQLRPGERAAKRQAAKKFSRTLTTFSAELEAFFFERLDPPERKKVWRAKNAGTIFSPRPFAFASIRALAASRSRGAFSRSGVFEEAFDASGSCARSPADWRAFRRGLAGRARAVIFEAGALAARKKRISAGVSRTAPRAVRRVVGVRARPAKARARIHAARWTTRTRSRGCAAARTSSRSAGRACPSGRCWRRTPRSPARRTGLTSASRTTSGARTATAASRTRRRVLHRVRGRGRPRAPAATPSALVRSSTGGEAGENISKPRRCVGRLARSPRPPSRFALDDVDLSSIARAMLLDDAPLTAHLDPAPRPRARRPRPRRARARALLARRRRQGRAEHPTRRRVAARAAADPASTRHASTRERRCA